MLLWSVECLFTQNCISIGFCEVFLQCNAMNIDFRDPLIDYMDPLTDLMDPLIDSPYRFHGSPYRFDGSPYGFPL